MEKLQQLRDWIAGSEHLVFFGGAGVSTESGIPDFRSVDGLYHQSYSVPPETILSHSFFQRDPDTFYQFYRDKLVCPGAAPNAAHLALARWEEQGRLKAVITQNIDELHQRAGSRNVLELHGTIRSFYCVRCRAPHPEEAVLACDGVPRCAKCGGVVRPDIVLYEEGLNQNVVQQAVDHIMRADVLIVGGTSLTVYPAAGFLNYYRGNKLVLINRDPTGFDGQADLVIHDSIGKVLGGIEV